MVIYKKENPNMPNNNPLYEDINQINDCVV